MTLEVRTGSAQWATPDSRLMIHIDVRIAGGRGWWRSTISKNDPLPEFAELFDRATAEPPEFGEIGAYVEPEPVEISAAIPVGIVPPMPAPAPMPVPPPPPIDWYAEAARFIAAIYTVKGVSIRASMNAWASAVALTADDERDEFDTACADMVPKLNSWEGRVFAERDRLIALDGATLADAAWPILPEGASQFIEWCAAP